jgi:hypothetical protein
MDNKYQYTLFVKAKMTHKTEDLKLKGAEIITFEREKICTRFIALYFGDALLEKHGLREKYDSRDFNIKINSVTQIINPPITK